MIPNGTIHFVEGRQLCEAQYVDYRAAQGWDNAISRVKSLLSSLNDKASNDRDFRVAVMSHFFPGVNSLEDHDSRPC